MGDLLKRQTRWIPKRQAKKRKRTGEDLTRKGNVKPIMEDGTVKNKQAGYREMCWRITRLLGPSMSLQ